MQPHAPAPTPAEGRRRWKRLTRICLLLAALTALAVAAGIRPAQRYLVESSASCVSCHAPSEAEVHGTAHAKLSCRSCHEHRFAQNLEQWALGLVSDRSVEHGRVDRTACKTCHAAGTVEPWRLTRTQGHVAHVLEAEKPLECSACHTLSQHRLTVRTDACSNCHADIALFDHTAREMPGGEAAPCLSCHSYLARTDVGKKTLATECRHCHGGTPSAPASELALTLPAKRVAPGQIHGNLATCSSCHNPHERDPGQRNVGADCTRCHDKVAEEHHAQKLPDKFDCSSCHQVHGPRAELAASCRNCHAQANEPATTLAREHERCTQCHPAHTFVAPPQVCTTCHEPVVSVLTGWQAKKHADCSNCHVPHAATPESARCADCHANQNHGHPSCTSCHAPHENAATVAGCNSCHEAERAAVSTSVPPHQKNGCETCHQPHNAGAELGACKACHTNQQKLVTTAKIPEHTRCASCHEPHAFAAGETGCADCHKLPPSGSHSGACKNCHETHGAPLGRAAECSNCHAQIPHTPGKHATCESCHAGAHAASAEVSPQCATCHAAEATAVSAWTTPKHRVCSSCHEPHQATKPAACASCHTQLVQPVKAAGHRCASCHDTHQAKSDAQLWGACGSCHTDNAVAVKLASGPTHSACQACHAPHTAAAPTCQSCHQSPALLHTNPKHQRCSSCHKTHAPSQITRATCLACHSQQVNHFPEASRCASCHLFQ
jgi:hypothetical protein